VLALGWYHLKSARMARWGNFEFPSEFLYIIPSGICTAVVIPTTTLMYTLPFSVMVAMVIMRACVIVIGRAVDAIQIEQGILHKKVYREENLAVVFAVIAASVQIFWVQSGGFDFLKSKAAVMILGSYITAYAIRIYIMNYYKNTRPKGMPLDNKAFFAVEQIAASITLVSVALAVFFLAEPLGLGGGWRAQSFKSAIVAPRPLWGWAVVSGLAYGIVAFFSVFIFMFKGRTATFANLVNRLTSLVAGTTATLILYFAFGMKFPSSQDWLSLAFILIAVAFLSVAEKKRVAELVCTHEVDLGPATRKQAGYP
ncbi:MAG: hypothetical protein HY747_01305, partial [Elusimicrobia bacterium]|nr:hypothetical protein [Elusimicrobiota bacterium]